MRLFADENTPRVIVRWLRDAGHDVTWAAELQPGETDDVWLSVAEGEGRLIVPLEVSLSSANTRFESDARNDRIVAGNDVKGGVNAGNS
jgi:hypothetical protein